MTEEYCWAITQAVGRSCCGPLGSSLSEMYTTFRMKFLLCVCVCVCVCIYIYIYIYIFVYLYVGRIAQSV